MKKKGKKLSFVGKLGLIVNYIFAVALLISYTASFVSPKFFSVIAFFGLAYPFLLAVNILFVLLWLVFRRKYLFISLIVVIAGYNNMLKTYRFKRGNETENTKGMVKILSYNVKNFDLYNYKKNWALNFENRDKIFRYLSDEGADIICFQEFVYDVTHEFKTLDTIVKFQKAKYSHFEYTKNSRNKNYFGIATFSDYPIVNKGKITFETNSNNICIYSDIKINNDTVRVYNLHFGSIHLVYEDYKPYEDTGKSTIAKKNYIELVKLLKDAFVRRAAQAEKVTEHISDCPYPFLICGDFNDIPSSYAYCTVARGIKDAFIESGKGFGNTYIGRFPSFRIDYILHSKGVKTYNFETVHVKYSDHYPITCYFELN